MAASDVASAAISHPGGMGVDNPQPDPTESDHASVEMQQDGDDANTLGTAANNKLDISQPALDTAPAISTPDVDPAGPTPVDDVASGIQPVADFVPKDGSNMSHPTPPPDEPFTTGVADIDMDVANVEAEEQSSIAPPPIPAQSEQSLVRPREDDAEDEPAAKRSKVEEDSVLPPPDAGTDMVLDGPNGDVAPEPMLDEPVAEVSTETVAETAAETTAGETTEELPEVQPAQQTPGTDLKVEQSQAEQSSADALASVENLDTVAADASLDAKPAVQPTIESQAAPQSEASSAVSTRPTYSKEPLTAWQKSSLLEKMKNLKKTKHSIYFLKPVDPVALNIPSYPDIIKNPMDLGTMDSKLKEGKYATVQDFADDFDLVVSNTRRFNGDAHNITTAALNMESYFHRVMSNVPSADEAMPSKAQKKRSPSLSREKPPRREARAVAPPAAPVPAPAPAPLSQAGSASHDTYALQADGTPTIRRQSSMGGRPARAIKPPQNREIPYAKPKRKEHQLELRFCEYVLDEMRSAKYGHLNHVFLQPVDPVALNIPHYHQVVKHPMDMATMGQKLRQGQYGTAGEFKKDFDLMISNCLLFNPAPNPVRDLGIQLQREFQQLWQTKGPWEKRNQPASNRASSASAEDDSVAEDEDEDDEDGEDDNKNATIRALQKQLAEMQSNMAALVSSKPKSKKAKDVKAPRKMGSLSSAPAKSKSAPKQAQKQKKPKTVTYDEKQEISEAVGRMDDKQVQRLTELITQNCAKYRDMEEMELEIDDLPNNVQAMLLTYVRSIFGNPNKKKAVREPSPEDAAALDDDDFEPGTGGSRGGKRKKHRPMGAQEQESAMNDIKRKLAQFSQGPTSGSESPTNSSFNAAAAAETSGDEESEESEEE